MPLLISLVAISCLGKADVIALHLYVWQMLLPWWLMELPLIYTECRLMLLPCLIFMWLMLLPQWLMELPLRVN